MEKKIGNIIIVTTKAREKEANYMGKVVKLQADKYNINVIVKMDEERRGCWWNLRDSLLKYKDGTHTMVIHDDITFDRNVLESVFKVLPALPEKGILAIYNPTNAGYIDAFNNKYRVVKTQSNFWIQATIYDNEVSQEFISFSDEKITESHPWDDTRLAYFLQKKGYYLYAIVPGLVQHLGAYRSNYSMPGKVGKVVRYSKTYNPGVNMDIDWKKAFENCYESSNGKVNKQMLIPGSGFIK